MNPQNVKNIVTYVLIAAVSVMLAVGIYIAYLSHQTYSFLKDPKTFSFGIFQNDTTLGYGLIPNSKGSQYIPEREQLPLYVDSLGFRQQPDGARCDKAGSILFVGDSYTFGDGVVADSSFSYLTGQRACMHVYNAACGGYGLPQFLLQAERNMPRFKPRNTVFQYSPWSAPRSVLAYVNRMIEKTPTPYFIQTDTGIAGIARPYYQSEIFRITGAGVFDKYRRSERGYADFFGFYREYGLAVFLPQFKNELVLRIKRMLGKVPAKATDVNAIEAYYLKHIGELQQHYGSKTMLLLIGMSAEESDAFKKRHATYLTAHPDLLIVDADAYMRKQAGIHTQEDFERAYMIWGGEPPRIVDRHYNERAHVLISEAIAAALQ